MEVYNNKFIKPILDLSELENRKISLKLPICSADELYDSNTVFKLFYPIPEAKTYLQHVGWIECTATLNVKDNEVNYILNNNCELRGTQSIDFSLNDDGIVIPDPQRFHVTANFIDNKLHGHFVEYIYYEDKLFLIYQIQYSYGKIVAYLEISEDEVILCFNSAVRQYNNWYDSTLYKQVTKYGHLCITNILKAYPDLDPSNTDWNSKLSTANQICTQYKFN